MSAAASTSRVLLPTSSLSWPLTEVNALVVARWVCVSRLLLLPLVHVVLYYLLHPAAAGLAYAMRSVKPRASSAIMRHQPCSNPSLLPPL